MKEVHKFGEFCKASFLAEDVTWSLTLKSLSDTYVIEHNVSSANSVAALRGSVLLTSCPLFLRHTQLAKLLFQRSFDLQDPFIVMPATLSKHPSSPY